LVAKFLVAATKILSIVPYFVAVTKPFFPCTSVEKHKACSKKINKKRKKVSIKIKRWAHCVLKYILTDFAHWAVIDPSKISTFMQNSPKNHLF